jgi:acetyl-CoA acetyltransferase
VIVAACRTPFGRYGGALASVALRHERRHQTVALELAAETTPINGSSILSTFNDPTQLCC